ncbi:Uncharacterised protein [Mycobacteroides abscessus subsp. abscessus]|nr:Uncharacterised protein [Mycobacteroides abscessus subsp. abscessus]
MHQGRGPIFNIQCPFLLKKRYSEKKLILKYRGKKHARLATVQGPSLALSLKLAGIAMAPAS